MLLRIACVRCRLASLWTDEPRSFLDHGLPAIPSLPGNAAGRTFCGVEPPDDAPQESLEA